MSERDRLEFVERRDGREGMLRFAEQTLAVYVEESIKHSRFKESIEVCIEVLKEASKDVQIVAIGIQAKIDEIKHKTEWWQKRLRDALINWDDAENRIIEVATQRDRWKRLARKLRCERDKALADLNEQRKSYLDTAEEREQLRRELEEIE